MNRISSHLSKRNDHRKYSRGIISWIAFFPSTNIVSIIYYHRNIPKSIFSFIPISCYSLYLQRIKFDYIYIGVFSVNMYLPDLYLHKFNLL